MLLNHFLTLDFPKPLVFNEGMNKLRATTVTLIVSIFIVAGLSFLIPVPTHIADAFAFKGQLAVTIVFSGFYIGAGLLFIHGLDIFKQELRQAYKAICVGMISLGILLLVLPVVTYLGVEDIGWVYGTISSPTIISDLLIFWGVRRFAKLLHIESRLLSFNVVLMIASAAAILSSFLPHIPLDKLEIFFDTSVGTRVISAVILGCAAYIAWLIRRTASPVYTTAMTWLVIALGANSLALIGSAVSDLVNERQIEVIVLPFIVSAACLIRAGYAFSAIQQHTDSPAKLHRKVTVLDVVLHTATLASNPREIDPILDKVRAITASFSRGHNLSRVDETALVDVYRKLERYLVSKESVRHYTPEGIRNILSRYFNLDASAADPIWRKLTH